MQSIHARAEASEFGLVAHICVITRRHTTISYSHPAIKGFCISSQKVGMVCHSTPPEQGASTVSFTIMAAQSVSTKSALRLGLETPLGAPLRRAIMRNEAAKERRFVYSQASKAGVLPLAGQGLMDLWEPKASSDTFFILGAGSSINNLTDQNFREIRSHRSVGVNTWPIHSFIPDFYSFECVSWIGDGLDFSRALRSLGRADISKVRPPVVVLRLKTDEEIAQLQTLPQGFEDRLFFYGRVAPSTRRVRNLARDLSSFLHSEGTTSPQVVLDSGASIVRMISLGISLGFRRIVLTGVDLNNSTYFWQENPQYDSRRELFPIFSRQVGSMHETQERGRRPFVAIEMFTELSKVFDKSFGGQMYVSSTESALASVMPVYRWK